MKFGKLVKIAHTLVAEDAGEQEQQRLQTALPFLTFKLKIQFVQLNNENK